MKTSLLEGVSQLKALFIEFSSEPVYQRVHLFFFLNLNIGHGRLHHTYLLYQEVCFLVLTRCRSDVKIPARTWTARLFVLNIFVFVSHSDCFLSKKLTLGYKSQVHRSKSCSHLGSNQSNVLETDVKLTWYRFMLNTTVIEMSWTSQ